MMMEDGLHGVLLWMYCRGTRTVDAEKSVGGVRNEG